MRTTVLVTTWLGLKFTLFRHEIASPELRGNKMIPKLPRRPSVSHKGDYGRGLLIGGSRGMSGAISLAGRACMKSGAGSLKIATPRETQPIVAGFDPCYMTVPLAQDEQGRLTSAARTELTNNLDEATAVGIGPGMGQSDDLVEFVSWAYSRIRQPMVIDADGMNCLARNPSIMMKPGGPRILTPHQGELRRLLDDKYSKPEELHYRAESLARESGIIFVMKGHRSIITNGEIRRQNLTGNSGMATAGSGDVLTGVILALLCQKMEPFDAAVLGCLIHGLAGDKGAKQIGRISLTATDIVEYLPNAIRSIKRNTSKKKSPTDRSSNS